ncbi:helix-turn-helix domain-containing protein [Bosea sp. NPDC055594]|jgi:AraC family transcriptional regulator
MGTQKWATYADFYKKSDYRVFPQEHRRSKGLYSFNMICVDQGPHDFEDPEVPETIVALPVTVDRHCTWRWSMLGRRHEETATPSRMVVVPSGVESRWAIDGSRKIIILTIPDTTARLVLGSSSTGKIREALIPLCADSIVDPFVEDLIGRMWGCSDGGHAVDRHMADGILMTLLAVLIKKADRFRFEEPLIAFPKWRLARVVDYVDAHLDQSISLEDLSNAAGISRTHFVRSFRNQTGETPHRWLMKRRLEKAKDLLQSTGEDLPQIASKCGFSSQSHLCTAMKAAVGMTPKGWRDRFRF